MDTKRVIVKIKIRKNKMKYIKTLVGAFVALALLATSVQAAPSTNTVSQVASDLGLWTFALSGQGNSTINNTSTKVSSNIGAEFQLGYNTIVITPAEIGVRQGIGYADGNGASWAFSTKLYSDWKIIRVGNLEAAAGANVGAIYGSNPISYTASPEVVGRVYLKKDVNLFGRVEYPFDLSAGKAQDNLIYTIGLQVRF